MTLNEIARALGLESLTPGIGAGQVEQGGAGVEKAHASVEKAHASVEKAHASVEKAHASDLLSDVLANAPAGAILLTIQVHMNVVAVALHAGLSAVVFTSGMVPDQAVRAKAEQEKLPLFSTAESTFDAAGKLFTMGLRGAGSRRA